MTTTDRILRWSQPCLAHPRLLWVLVLLSLVTTAPALWTGLFNDDYCQQVEILESPTLHEALRTVGLGIDGPGHLGTLLRQHFIAVGPDKNRGQFKDYGALPWWTGRDYQVSLLRPLASLAAWLDMKLFDSSVLWRHVHTLAWLGLVVWVAGILMRRFIDPPWVAGLAILLFALDDNHYFPAMWIANRNQLICLVFAMLCLLAHHRWRTQGSAAAGLLACLLLAAALLSAEAGVATFAYLLAYAVAYERGPWRWRLSSLLPAFALILLWRVGYNALGFGARGGGFYFDPGNDPLAFAQAAWQRGPFLAAGQWFSLPPDLFGLIHDDIRQPFVVALALLCLAMPILLWPLLARDRSARFWFIGMHLALVPVCAAVPMGRNLLFCSLGGYALIALFIAHCLADGPVGRGGRGVTLPARALCWVLIVIHLPLAALAKVGAPWMTEVVAGRIESTTRLAYLEIEDNRPLVLINAPNPAAFLYVPFRLLLQKGHLPSAIRMLAPGYGPLTVTRPDAHTLTIRAQEASLLRCPPTTRLEIAHLYRYLSDFRGPGEAFDTATSVEFPEVTVRISALDPQGQPLEIACDFPEPLEKMRLHWVYWDWQTERYTAYPLPPIGSSRTLEGPH